jgi:DNA-binding transcriptional ArsR family regulator
MSATVQPGEWTQTPNVFVRCPHLSPLVKLTYLVLASYAGNRDKAWPGKESLARDVGVSVPTLREALKVLIDLGLIEAERRGNGKTTRYKVTKFQIEKGRRTARPGGERAEQAPSARPNLPPKKQTEKPLPPRPKDSFGEYKEEADSAEIDTAAAGKPAPNAAAEVPAHTPERVPPVPLVEMPPEQLNHLSPEELLNCLREQHPDYWPRVEAKMKRAHTSPLPYAACAVRGTLLPEIREKQARRQAVYIPPPMSDAERAFAANYANVQAAQAKKYRERNAMMAAGRAGA